MHGAHDLAASLAVHHADFEDSSGLTFAEVLRYELLEVLRAERVQIEFGGDGERVRFRVRFTWRVGCHGRFEDGWGILRNSFARGMVGGGRLELLPC